MKTHHTLLAIGSSFLALALPVVAQAPKVVWELSKGIKAPESAYFDKQTGNIYLSQVGEGGGLGKDGDGVISVLKPDGSVVKKFILDTREDTAACSVERESKKPTQNNSDQAHNLVQVPS